MAQRIALRLALATVLAALAAGCGSASSSTSSTSPTTTAAAARTTPTAATRTHPLNFAAAIPPGLLRPRSPAARPPAGWVRYHEHGFSFLAPSGFKPAPDSGIGGLPKTASVRFLTLAGQPLQKTSDQLMLGFNSKLQFDIDQVTTNLMASDRPTGR